MLRSETLQSSTGYLILGFNNNSNYNSGIKVGFTGIWNYSVFKVRIC